MPCPIEIMQPMQLCCYEIWQPVQWDYAILRSVQSYDRISHINYAVYEVCSSAAYVVLFFGSILVPNYTAFLRFAFLRFALLRFCVLYRPCGSCHFKAKTVHA